MKIKGWVNGARVSRSKMNKCKNSGEDMAYLKRGKEDSLVRVEQWKERI